jgi:hypothetical protein
MALMSFWLIFLMLLFLEGLIFKDSGNYGSWFEVRVSDLDECVGVV